MFLKRWVIGGLVLDHFPAGLFPALFSLLGLFPAGVFPAIFFSNNEINQTKANHTKIKPYLAVSYLTQTNLN